MLTQDNKQCPQGLRPCLRRCIRLGGNFYLINFARHNSCKDDIRCMSLAQEIGTLASFLGPCVVAIVAGAVVDVQPPRRAVSIVGFLGQRKADVRTMERYFIRTQNPQGRKVTSCRLNRCQSYWSAQERSLPPAVSDVSTTSPTAPTSTHPRSLTRPNLAASILPSVIDFITWTMQSSRNWPTNLPRFPLRTGVEGQN